MDEMFRYDPFVLPKRHATLDGTDHVTCELGSVESQRSVTGDPKWANIVVLLGSNMSTLAGSGYKKTCIIMQVCTMNHLVIHAICCKSILFLTQVCKFNKTVTKQWSSRTSSK